jgi:putative acetyltransferase
VNADVEILDEQPGDAASIQRVHREAFGGDVEVRLVDLLRARNKSLVSLVAVIRAEVVGHILFSAVTIGGATPGVRSIGLAPVAVLPGSQRKGIGSILIRDGLARCKNAGYGLVVVLGDPAYYGRFGFRAADTFGLENEYGVRDEFMVLELTKGAIEEVSGLVRYAPEFKEADEG